MTQQLTLKPVSQTQTCSQCPHFNDYNESNGRGWCRLFEQQARKHHQRTNDCDLFADTDPIDTPHPTFAIDHVVKVIDADEHHTEWASFIVIGRKYNPDRYRSTEAYLTETSWYFLLTNINYQGRVRVKRKKGKKVYAGTKSILFSFVPSFLSPSEASSAHKIR